MARRRDQQHLAQRCGCYFNTATVHAVSLGIAPNQCIRAYIRSLDGNDVSPFRGLITEIMEGTLLLELHQLRTNREMFALLARCANRSIEFRVPCLRKQERSSNFAKLQHYLLIIQGKFGKAALYVNSFQNGKSSVAKSNGNSSDSSPIASS